MMPINGVEYGLRGRSVAETGVGSLYGSEHGARRPVFEKKTMFPMKEPPIELVQGLV